MAASVSFFSASSASVTDSYYPVLAIGHLILTENGMIATDNEKRLVCQVSLNTASKARFTQGRTTRQGHNLIFCLLCSHRQPGAWRTKGEVFHVNTVPTELLWKLPRDFPISFKTEKNSWMVCSLVYPMVQIAIAPTVTVTMVAIGFSRKSLLSSPSASLPMPNRSLAYHVTLTKSVWSTSRAFKSPDSP